VGVRLIAMASARCVAAIGEVDPRVHYPCYKSLDDLIDVERLKSLDAYLTERLKTHARADTGDYFLNEHRLDTTTPYRPGVREIWLSRTRPGVPYDYLDLDKPSLWERAPAADEFEPLMDFIATLPFRALGRMLVIYDDSGNEVPAHRDHLDTALCHEFIWFRTNLTKPFYVLDEKSNEKLHVGSYSAWFDTVNQFHGSDAAPGLSFSIRVDGVFDDALRERLPARLRNAASIPALWASLSDPDAAS
jgi:hypothetical protein